MFDSVRQQLVKSVRVHLESAEAIREHQQQNLEWIRSTMTEPEREFWSQDRVFTAEDLRQAQQAQPPWGVWQERPITWPRISSGSSGRERLRFPYGFDSVLRAGIGCARAFDVRGITEQDALFSYDPGRMYVGHMNIRTGFSLILPGHVIESQVTTLREKVEQCLANRVTFVCGVPRNLEKMARFVIDNRIDMPLRGCASTGYAFTKSQMELVQRAFGCEIIDFYGSVECGNVFWSCSHGKNHVNIDLTMIENKNDQTLFTGISVMPIFNYHTGDHIRYEWPDRVCGCGSHLPVVTEFSTKLSLNDYKNKE